MNPFSFESFYGIFRTNEEQRHYFELLSYAVFCKKYNNGNGVDRAKNQAYIETVPVNGIGFQAKHYDDGNGLNKKKNRDSIKNAMINAKKKYKIKTFILYSNQDLPQNTQKPEEKSSYIQDLEEKAKDLNINIEFFFKSHFENLFYKEDYFYLLNFFFSIDSSGYFYFKKLLKETKEKCFFKIENENIIEELGLNRLELKYNEEKKELILLQNKINAMFLLENSLNSFIKLSINDFIFQNNDFVKFTPNHYFKNVIITDINECNSLSKNNVFIFINRLKEMISFNWNVFIPFDKDDFLFNFFEHEIETQLHILENFNKNVLYDTLNHLNIFIPDSLISIIIQPFYFYKFLHYNGSLYDFLEYIHGEEIEHSFKFKLFKIIDSKIKDNSNALLIDTFDDSINKMLKNDLIKSNDSISLEFKNDIFKILIYIDYIDYKIKKNDFDFFHKDSNIEHQTILVDALYFYLIKIKNNSDFDFVMEKILKKSILKTTPLCFPVRIRMFCKLYEVKISKYICIDDLINTISIKNTFYLINENDRGFVLNFKNFLINNFNYIKNDSYFKHALNLFNLLYKEKLDFGDLYKSNIPVEYENYSVDYIFNNCAPFLITKDSSDYILSLIKDKHFNKEVEFDLNIYNSNNISEFSNIIRVIFYLSKIKNKSVLSNEILNNTEHHIKIPCYINSKNKEINNSEINDFDIVNFLNDNIKEALYTETFLHLIFVFYIHDLLSDYFDIYKLNYKLFDILNLITNSRQEKINHSSEKLYPHLDINANITIWTDKQSFFTFFLKYILKTGHFDKDDSKYIFKCIYENLTKHNKENELLLTNDFKNVFSIFIIKSLDNDFIKHSDFSKEIYELIDKYKLYRLYISLDFGYNFNSNYL